MLRERIGPHEALEESWSLGMANVFCARAVSVDQDVSRVISGLDDLRRGMEAGRDLDFEATVHKILAAGK